MLRSISISSSGASLAGGPQSTGSTTGSSSCDCSAHPAPDFTKRGAGSGILVQACRPAIGSVSRASATMSSRAAAVAWRLATVVDVRVETPRTRTLVLDVPGWPGHRAGQHVDVRLTAEDGYRAQRSYSIASAPQDAKIALTVERLDDGEVSPYLTDVLRNGDGLELRGPIGGYFVWDVAQGGPLFLVAGGSGIVPLMAMLRHRTAALATADLRHNVPARLLYSSHRWDELIYGAELGRLAEDDPTLEVAF